MPKMKTKKSASKRFTARPGGTIKRGQAFNDAVRLTLTNYERSISCLE